FGLRANIERRYPAGAESAVTCINPVVPAVAANHERDVGVTGLERVFGADPSADLDAGIGSGNVEEPGAIDATNLHVFDRFGLNGKIGSLCSRYRNETRRGTEEKAFHHLHRDLQVCCREGSVCWAPKRPGRSPKVPAKPPGSLSLA